MNLMTFRLNVLTVCSANFEVDLQFFNQFVIPLMSTDQMSTCVRFFLWSSSFTIEVDLQFFNQLVIPLMSTDQMSTCVPYFLWSSSFTIEVDLQFFNQLVIPTMSTDQMSTCVALLFTCFTSFTSDVFAFVFNTFSFVNFRWTFASDECRNITNSLFV